MIAKICGITTLADARLAADCGADFIGLILAPSPRQVSLQQAREILAALPAGTSGVLVFRDAPCADVAAALRAAGAAWVQLHGCEPPDYLALLQAQCPAVRIIKAFEVTAARDAERILDFLRAARQLGAAPHVILLDAPKGASHPGYDCFAQVARQLSSRPPRVWCAGGLNAGNVLAALSAGAFDGADVASGVETSPGRKSLPAMAAFMAALRAIPTRDATRPQ